LLLAVLATAFGGGAQGDAQLSTRTSADGAVAVGAVTLSKPAHIYRVPRRIAHDGSVDVTDALASFINSRPNDSLIKLARDGRYRIDGTLEIRDPHGLRIKGRGATLFAGTPGDMYRRHLRITGGDNLVIRNLTIVGANPNAGMADAAWDPAHEFQHGIELDGVQGALLGQVKIYDVYGDFVYVGPAHPSEGLFIPSRNVTIQNSRFKRNGRQGISVTYAEDVLIQNNHMGNCRRAWVAVEPPGAIFEVYRLTIQNNTVGPHRLNFFANAGRGPNVGSIVIANNRTLPGATFGDITITRGEDPSAGGGYRGPYLIEGNVGPTRGGFRLEQAAEITIRNNDMPFPPDVVVVLNDAHTIRVHDNSFTGATSFFKVNDATPGLSYDYTEWNNQL
jgi:hypothetical protein